MVILELIHATEPDSRKAAFIGYKVNRFGVTDDSQ